MTDDIRFSRRSLLGFALGAAIASPADAAPRGTSALKAIHKHVGGRVGVHILDSQSGRRLGLDDDSRYAMASTCKMPLAAALLWQVDHGAFPLTHSLRIGKEDLLSSSPVLEPRIAAGDVSMSVRDLCAAAVTFSDNAATNVLLAAMGGPAALTSFVRSIGDEVTRFDRNELELNSNLPGDLRDTTTPRAMADTMLKIFTQDVLSVTSRALLIDWMSASRSGMDRVRAGLPRDWQAADKTGWGQNSAYNDLVLAWPPGRRPIVIAAFMSESKLTPKDLSAAHAEIGALVAREKWP
jgi:beta-lactamase class A